MVLTFWPDLDCTIIWAARSARYLVNLSKSFLSCMLQNCNVDIIHIVAIGGLIGISREIRESEIYVAVSLPRAAPYFCSTPIIHQRSIFRVCNYLFATACTRGKESSVPFATPRTLHILSDMFPDFSNFFTYSPGDVRRCLSHILSFVKYVNFRPVAVTFHRARKT